LKPTGITLESACKEFAEACKILNGVSVLQAAKDYTNGYFTCLIVLVVRLPLNSNGARSE
jgi:hypothetical protein